MTDKTTEPGTSVKGKWVLLTGASGGIGECIAQELYQAGAKLILVGRDQKKLLAIRIRHQFSASRAAIIEADINSVEGREKIIFTCNKLPEPVSILINNAGLSDFHFLDQQPSSTVTALIQTNLLSPMLLTQILLPVLKKSEAPVIVNMGSTFGSIGYPGYAAYCASKFGLRGFTEALRRELANTSIAVCYVAPRATRTSINSKLVNEMNQLLGNATDDPALVAGQVLKAIIKRRPVTYIGWPEKLFARINQIFPGIVDGALRKQLPVIQKFSQQRISP